MSSDDKEDFERLSLTDSSYAKVIFHDVKDWYLSNQDLNCVCTIMSSVGPQEGDQIGLYKVGWSALEEYIAAVPCKVSNDSQTIPSTDITFTFIAASLPDDDGNYYQFCYTSADGNIRGGSTPFTFKSSPVDDFLSVEDFENDLLLVQTRTSVLEDSLQKAIKEKTNIQIEKQLLQKTLNSHKTSLATLANSQKEKDFIIEELKKKVANTEMLASKNEAIMKEELLKQEHFINDLKAAIATMEKEKQDICNQLQNSISNSKIIEETVSSLQNQVTTFKSKIAAQEAEMKSQLDVIFNFKANAEALEMLNENITSRLIDTEHMLTAMATSKSLASKELQKHLEKEAELESQVRAIEEKNKCLYSEVDNFKRQNSQLQESLNNSLSQNVSLTDENGLLLKKIEMNSRLESEIKGLHHRLTLGAEEYKRKYLECHKLQKRVEKLQEKLNVKFLQHVPQNEVVGVQKNSLVSVSKESEPVCVTDLAVNFSTLSTSPKETAVVAPNERDVTSEGHAVSQEQNEKISAEMENQLKKFSIKSNSPCSSEKSSSPEPIINPTESTSLHYPYPQYYPYPYPGNTAPHYHGITTNQFDERIQINGHDVFYPHNSGSECLDATSISSQTESFYMLNSYQHHDPLNPTMNVHHSDVAMNTNYCINNYDQPIGNGSNVYFTPETRLEGQMEGHQDHLTCPICNEILPENSDINDHIDSHLFYRCPLCPAQFEKESNSYEDFNRHVEDHID